MNDGLDRDDNDDNVNAFFGISCPIYRTPSPLRFAVNIASSLTPRTGQTILTIQMILHLLPNSPNPKSKATTQYLPKTTSLLLPQVTASTSSPPASTDSAKSAKHYTKTQAIRSRHQTSRRRLSLRRETAASTSPTTTPDPGALQKTTTPVVMEAPRCRRSMKNT